MSITIKAIVLDNKNNQAKHCEVTITLGAVPKAKSSCVALRDLVDEALSPWRPAAQAGHIGLRPGFIDEDQPRRVVSP